jgi:hypothetical protein
VPRSPPRRPLAASGAEAKRLADLAAQDANAAPRPKPPPQAGADRARLTLACQRVGLEFGAGLARLGCGRCPPGAAGGGKARAAAHRFAAGRPARRQHGAGGRWRRGDAESAGPGGRGDAQLQTAACWRWPRRRAARASVGRVLAARIGSAGGQAGVLVPRSASCGPTGAVRLSRHRQGWLERVALTGAIRRAGWQVPAARCTGRPRGDGGRRHAAGAGTRRPGGRRRVSPMLSLIVRQSLRYPWLVLLAALMLLGAACGAARRAF